MTGDVDSRATRAAQMALCLVRPPLEADEFVRVLTILGHTDVDDDESCDAAVAEADGVFVGRIVP